MFELPDMVIDSVVEVIAMIEVLGDDWARPGGLRYRSSD